MSPAQNLNIKEVVVKKVVKPAPMTEVVIVELVDNKEYPFKLKLVSNIIEVDKKSVILHFLLTHRGKPVDRRIVGDVQNKIASSIEDYIRVKDIFATVNVDHCDQWISCKLDSSGVKVGGEIEFRDNQVTNILVRIDRLFSATPPKVRKSRSRKSRKGTPTTYVNNSREGRVS